MHVDVRAGGVIHSARTVGLAAAHVPAAQGRVVHTLPLRRVVVWS